MHCVALQKNSNPSTRSIPFIDSSCKTRSIDTIQVISDIPLDLLIKRSRLANGFRIRCCKLSNAKTNAKHTPRVDYRRVPPLCLTLAAYISILLWNSSIDQFHHSHIAHNNQIYIVQHSNEDLLLLDVTEGHGDGDGDNDVKVRGDNSTAVTWRRVSYVAVPSAEHSYDVEARSPQTVSVILTFLGRHQSGLQELDVNPSSFLIRFDQIRSISAFVSYA